MCNPRRRRLEHVLSHRQCTKQHRLSGEPQNIVRARHGGRGHTVRRKDGINAQNRRRQPEHNGWIGLFSMSRLFELAGVHFQLLRARYPVGGDARAHRLCIAAGFRQNRRGNRYQDLVDFPRDSRKNGIFVRTIADDVSKSTAVDTSSTWTTKLWIDRHCRLLSSAWNREKKCLTAQISVGLAREDRPVKDPPCVCVCTLELTETEDQSRCRPRKRREQRS